MTSESDSLHTPLLVRTPARAGSTLTMQILASSPAIGFDRRYPYEIRHLSYLIRAAQVITMPLNRRVDTLPFAWDPRLLIRDDLRYIGPLPTKSELLDSEQWLRSSSEALYRSFCQELKKVASDSVYYAEKVASADIVRHVREFTDVKILYGLRDPRDQMVSMMAFNEKRGTVRFGWRRDDDELSFAKRLSERTQRYLKSIERTKRHAREDGFLVRYEDLIREPQAVIDRLSSWLEVELDDRVVNEQREQMERTHTTSASPEESIGRWRSVLSPETQRLFERELGDQLRAMDWE